MRRSARFAIAGFTIIELMIVAFIIGIIAGIAVPSYLVTRGSAQRKACHLTRYEIDLQLILFTSNQSHTPQNIDELVDAGYLPPVNCPAWGTFELRLRDGSPEESFYYHPTPYVWCSVHGSVVESEEKDDDDDVPVAEPLGDPVQLNS